MRKASVASNDPCSARVALTVVDEEAAPNDARPCYRIAVFGLALRLQRVLEIIVRHARYNSFRYLVREPRGPEDFDIALVDMTARGGADVARTLRSVPQALPVIGVGRRSDRRRERDDLMLATFGLDVLRVLNRAAETLALRARTRLMASRLMLAGTHLRLPLVQGRQPRALVVEPSPSVRSQLGAALRQMGIDSEGVGTLAQAEDVLAMRRYELLLLEPRQPDGDGLAMLGRLRRATTPSGLSIPVIVVSARSGILDLARAAWAGCSGYLDKPVPLRTLHATVERILTRYLQPLRNAPGQRRPTLLSGPAKPAAKPAGQRPMRRKLPLSP